MRVSDALVDGKCAWVCGYGDVDKGCAFALLVCPVHASLSAVKVVRTTGGGGGFHGLYLAEMLHVRTLSIRTSSPRGSPRRPTVVGR